MNLEKIQSLLASSGIQVSKIIQHSKASESYVEVAFYHEDEGLVWEGYVPYFYRRTGLFLETEEELAAYLLKIKPYFSRQEIADWIAAEREIWEMTLSGRNVTKHFFFALATLEWTSDFPVNDNPQRRIQDIKDMGYTISSRQVGKKMERLLVPIPTTMQTGYETFSAAFRKRALKVLDHLNVYELSEANRAGLLPDHKFPEIRWDAATRAENPDDMPEDEIKAKFQLLDNQRNQQKREVCRNCFSTGKRGTLFGLQFFYEGDERWPTDVPKTGKAAESGCVGCGWYDIEKWRAALNKVILAQR